MKDKENDTTTNLERLQKNFIKKSKTGLIILKKSLKLSLKKMIYFWKSKGTSITTVVL